MNTRTRWIWSGVSGCLFVAATWALYAPLGTKNYFDDSYITFCYARNLAHGLGMVFQPGELSNSASSPFWTFLLALGIRAGGNAEALAWWLALAWGGLTWALVAYWGGSKGASHLERAAVSLPLALAGLLGVWASQGMETTAFAFALVLGVWRLGKRGVGTGEALALGLVPLVRYEGILLAAAALLVGPRRLFKHGWKGWASMLVLPVCWACFCRVYFGTWLPQSLMVKRLQMYYSPILRVRLFVLWNNWESTTPLLAALFAVMAFWVLHLRRLSAASALLFWTMLLALGAVFFGPTGDLSRYGTPFLPVAVLAVQRGAVILRRTRGNFPGRILVGALGVVLLVTAVTANAQYRDNTARWRAGQAARRVVGNTLARYAQGQTVLSTDLGLIAWMAPRSRFMDADALVNHDLLSALQRHIGLEPWFKAGHPTWIADTEASPGKSIAEKILAAPERCYKVPSGLGFDIRDCGLKFGHLFEISSGGVRCVLQNIQWPANPPVPAVPI